MNLRKLLALDPSFMESGDGSGRYRMTKHNLLPEFGNSGTEIPALQGEEGPAFPAPPQKAAMKKPARQPRRSLNLLGFRIQLPFSKPPLLRPEVKTPVPAPKPTFKGGIAFKTESIEQRKSEQANQLLSQVTVVRNDLNDSGVDLLTLRRPATPGKPGATSGPAAADPLVTTEQIKAFTP